MKQMQHRQNDMRPYECIRTRFQINWFMFACISCKVLEKNMLSHDLIKIFIHNI